MSFSVGIIGLPNAGKSTLFQALTKKHVDIAAYPFTTIHPNIGVVAVPDERLKKLAEVLRPSKVTPAIIEFVDIAGLVRGAYKGVGLGNQFLSHIRECDVLLHLIRCFDTDSVEHVEGSLEPQRDKDIVETELLLKDLETIDRTIEATKEKARGNKEAQKKLEVLQRVRSSIAQGTLASHLDLKEDEQEIIKQLFLLTAKPLLYVLNIGNQKECGFPLPHIVINAEEELEASDFSEDERESLNFTSRLDPLVKACYNSLDFITFFTVAGGKELRAWSIKRGTRAAAAGGKIHSDFQEKFIRAEVISWDILVEAESWTRARELGVIKTVGKDYVVQDGDIVEFKI